MTKAKSPHHTATHVLWQHDDISRALIPDPLLRSIHPDFDHRRHASSRIAISPISPRPTPVLLSPALLPIIFRPEGSLFSDRLDGRPRRRVAEVSPGLFAASRGRPGLVLVPRRRLPGP